MPDVQYEEHLHITDNGSDIEIIRLYDLNQEIVLDNNNDPYHLQLRDIDTGKVLARFGYGQDDGDDDFGLDGFSFSVSPRHNYLIVKEVQCGVSLETLYASLYCLKRSPITDFTGRDNFSSTYRTQFSSHYFLTLLFSHDEHENTLWVHGQQIDNLTTIDVYKYGGFQPDSEPNILRAKMFIESSYPAVALENILRDREFSGAMSDHKVVNTLDKMAEQNDRELCQLKLNGLLPLNLKAMRSVLGVYDASATLQLCHSFIGTRLFDSDLDGLKSKVEQLGMYCQLLTQQPEHGKKVTMLFVYGAIADVDTFNHQSIALMNQLAKQYLAVYEGFKLTVKPSSLLTWQDQPSLSYAHYKQLSALLNAGSVNTSQYCELFNRLMVKHKIHGLWELFTPTQQQNINDISLVLSQFDDYEQTDEEVVKAVQQAFPVKQGS